MTAIGTPINQKYTPINTGVYHSGPDLGMVAGDSAAAAANAAALAAHWGSRAGVYPTVRTAKTGMVLLAPQSYWTNTVATASAGINGITLVGAGGGGLWEGYHYDFANLPGGAQAKLIAGTSGMTDLLRVTTYGGRFEYLTLCGNYKLSNAGAYQLATKCETLLRFKGNPTGYGTGKSVFHQLTLKDAVNGILFDEGTSGLGNADNSWFGYIESQRVTGATIKLTNAQNLPFKGGYIHHHYGGSAIHCERGGKIEGFFIELVDGVDGVGPTALRLGDCRENENAYSYAVSVDNTALLPGLKLLKMDSAMYRGRVDLTIHNFGNEDMTTAEDCVEGKGGVTINIFGGPLCPGMLALESDGVRGMPVVNFWGCPVLPAMTDLRDIVGTASGTYDITFHGCRYASNTGRRIATTSINETS